MRVLIVEDDDSLASMLARVLRADGHFVTVARDGDEALAAFEREGPHACLVDALLPKRTGFEVCKEIRAKAGDKVGLLMMSATFRALGPRAEALKDSGADGFLAKPFVLSDVRKRVRELGDRAQQSRRTAVSPRQWLTPTTAVGEPGGMGPFTGAHHVAHALIDCAREKCSGLLVIEEESSRLEIAFLAGVPVGARDNLRENQLGERLLREGRITHDDLKRVNERIAAGERVAEALLALRLCPPEIVLTTIEEQVFERVSRALTWRKGTMRFEAGDDRARALAVCSVDLVDHILDWALDPLRESNALAFLMARTNDRVVRTLDFEDALAAYAIRRPTSRLPALLAAAVSGTDGVVVGMLAQQAPDDARDLYALWLAGLVRAQHEQGSLRAIPRPAVTPRVAAPKPASDAGTRVAAALLRVRGRAPWQALGLTVGASPESLQLALAAMRRDVGPHALAGVDLGDHHTAAKELWELLDDLEVQIAVSGALDTVEIRALADVSPEQAFLDGQIALQRGELRTACAAFESALKSKPNDPDMNAWHAWASILAGDDETMAMDVLETAARAYPEAMRPVYFLGLAAQRRGDLEQAKAYLADACARAPFDLEVRAARAALV